MRAILSVASSVATSLLVAVSVPSAAQAQEVRIEPPEAVVEVDRSGTLEAVVRDADGDVVEDAPVRWAVVSGDAVDIDQEGTVTGVRPGRARVAAVSGQSAGFAEITVPTLPPAELEASLFREALPSGTSAPIRVRAADRFGEVVPDPELRFESDDPEVAGVDGVGRVFARAPGSTTVRVTAGSASARVPVRVVEGGELEFALTPERSEVRTGDVVRFRLDARSPDGAVSTLRPAWSVDGSGASVAAEGGEGVFVARDPGRYQVTARIGEDRVRTAVVEVEPREYESRLVEVGRGPISSNHSGDMWAFEGLDGRDYAYVGTFMHDWMKAWDVTDPANPVLTDSVQVDARRINDVKIHPDRSIGIITREGASNRRNGIVLLDLTEPAHPTVLSEYVETVSGGVHNVWIDGERDLVYAVHDGTMDLHILDISDPEQPAEVGRWGLDRDVKTLHDVIVQDGYAYLSYWDDGLVILDAGAGTHGGTPTDPTFVSRTSYPEGHTHVAWRYEDYVFVGDEIFPDDWDPDRPIEARGYIHVLDVSDIENPREVAKYEVPEAGAHNVWVEDDRLYVGYYQAGLRVVDVSGELRGDLYRQGREIARLLPIDEEMVVPNWPMTWGAQLFKGHIFSSDLNSGLWITRLDERGRVVF